MTVAHNTWNENWITLCPTLDVHILFSWGWYFQFFCLLFLLENYVCRLTLTGFSRLVAQSSSLSSIAKLFMISRNLWLKHFTMIDGNALSQSDLEELFLISRNLWLQIFHHVNAKFLKVILKSKFELWSYDKAALAFNFSFMNLTRS